MLEGPITNRIARKLKQEDSNASSLYVSELTPPAEQYTWDYQCKKCGSIYAKIMLRGREDLCDAPCYSSSFGVINLKKTGKLVW